MVLCLNCLVKWGDAFNVLVEKDQLAVKDMRDGDEINFNVSTEIKREFLSAEIGNFIIFFILRSFFRGEGVMKFFQGHFKGI